METNKNINGTGTATNVSNAYTVAALSVTYSAYKEGYYFITMPAINTGAATLKFDALAAKAVKVEGAACVGGEIGVKEHIFYFNGTDFTLLDPVQITRFATVQNETTHTLVDADSGKQIEVTSTLTVPTGLKVGFQCSIGLDNATAQTLTTTGNTVKTSNVSTAKISANGSISIMVIAANTLRIVGLTEA